MARSKPYTVKLTILDIVLTICTSGGWIFVMFPRELYRRQPTYSLAHAIIDFLLILLTAGLWTIVMLFLALRRK